MVAGLIVIGSMTVIGLDPVRPAESIPTIGAATSDHRGTPNPDRVQDQDQGTSFFPAASTARDITTRDSIRRRTASCTGRTGQVTDDVAVQGRVAVVEGGNAIVIAMRRIERANALDPDLIPPPQSR